MPHHIVVVPCFLPMPSMPSAILLFLLLCLADANSNDCSPIQFPCGNTTVSVGCPFFTDTMPSNCRKFHRIQCVDLSPVVQFNQQGLWYVVKSLSLRNGTIVVHDLRLNSYTWETGCFFLYQFKQPLLHVNLTNSTLVISKNLFSFSCDSLVQDANPFNESCGLHYPLPCQDYNLYFSLDIRYQHSSNLPAYCSNAGGLWFSWELSFGGDEADTGDISLLSAGYSRDWDLHLDCFRCSISGSNCGGASRVSGESACLCGQSCGSKGSGKKLEKIILGVSLGLSAGLALCFLCILLRRRRKTHHQYCPSKSHPKNSSTDPELLCADCQTHLFSYAELEAATGGFDPSQILGDGGFGTVYKGKLRDGRTVAVKRLYDNNCRRVEQFVNEAAILSRLRHPSLVTLYGCTSPRSRELLLVYEFIPNGTVADHLHGDRACERALSWPVRLRVAAEAADALAFLHAVDPPVVHRDVKTTNILLDADFHVKIADFGLSRLFPAGDISHVSTAPQGTPGYVDPEYHRCFQLTEKSDVYSFGVVLAELISTKPAVDMARRRNEINLANMAVDLIQRGELEKLVDPELGFESDRGVEMTITVVAELAFRCLQQDGDMRPTIGEVLEVLSRVEGKAGEVDECGEAGVGMRDDAGLLKDAGPASPDSEMHQ